MDTTAPKRALEYLRANDGMSAKSAARTFATTVDELHNAANCSQKHACKGGGCRLR